MSEKKTYPSEIYLQADTEEATGKLRACNCTMYGEEEMDDLNNQEVAVYKLQKVGTAKHYVNIT